MKVRMVASISGTRDGVDWPQRGEVTDLPAAEAEHMIGQGLATPVDGPEVETATADPAPENAAATPKKRKRKAPAKKADG